MDIQNILRNMIKKYYIKFINYYLKVEKRETEYFLLSLSNQF